ncbi:MAG: NAD(P)-binding protein, partial [Rhodospirillaceae bacterium]|nr:NAD(P)-binding protein [Rhodospirillaceae bacterium]
MTGILHIVGAGLAGLAAATAAAKAGTRVVVHEAAGHA